MSAIFVAMVAVICAAAGAIVGHKIALRRLAKCFGPKDFARGGGWSGRGVLAKFDNIHGLDILVSDDVPPYTETTFNKDWFTDADEVLFRDGKQIKLYWRKKGART